MTLVVDASALVALVTVVRPEGPWVESVIAGETLVGPEVALAESSNILRRMELVGELSTLEAAIAHRDLLNTAIELHGFAPFGERVWELRHNVVAFDAWYVALAETLDCPLVTLDLRLSRASGPTCEVLTPP